MGKNGIDRIGSVLLVQFRDSHSLWKFAGVPYFQAVFEQHHLHAAGDSWWHEISVVGIRPYKKGEKHRITFVDGQGACPPEDCGGVPGYERLLEMAKKKRKSAEEKEELEWYDIDKHYDPNDPDVISCQEAAEEWDEALREK